jgi:hypothetical protein
MRRLLYRRGFSDRLYYLNFRMVWIFTWSCFALNAISGYLGIGDLAIINIGVPAAFAELGIHTGFIVWKAKVENCRKNKDVSRVKELEEIEL